MKKLAFTIILLPLLAMGTTAQVLGLYAKNITVSKPKPGSGNPVLHKEAGPFYLVYSHEYCKFYMPVGGWVSFPALNFKTDILGDGTIMESFISDETESTPYGRYNVMIFKGKQGYTFEIAMPQSYTLMGENAEAYNGNGKVPNAPYISNWKELKSQFDKQDSIARIKEQQRLQLATKKRIDDSLFLVQKDSILAANKIAKLNEGNNYQQMNLRWLADTLSARIKSTTYFYSDFKLHLDRDGIITKAEPVKPMAPAADPMIAQINRELIGRKLKAFKAADGNAYPSYTNVYITLFPPNGGGR